MQCFRFKRLDNYPPVVLRHVSVVKDCHTFSGKIMVKQDWPSILPVN